MCVCPRVHIIQNGKWVLESSPDPDDLAIDWELEEALLQITQEQQERLAQLRQEEQEAQERLRQSAQRLQQLEAQYEQLLEWKKKIEKEERQETINWFVIIVATFLTVYFCLEEVMDWDFLF